MRKLSTALRAVLVVLAFTAFTACDSTTAPIVSDAAGGDATVSHTSVCPGNSGGDCSMSVSVIATASGHSSLVVRTGRFDQTTGEHATNGTFEKIQYKIYDGRGKLISTRNSDASGVEYRTSLPGSLQPDYRVEVQANIRNHSGKKGTSVVRGTASPAYLPDIDLSAETIERLENGTRQPLGTVAAGVSHTYVTDFANLTTVANSPSALGIKVLCVVSVGGVLQVPGNSNGFNYVGSAYQYIAPGATEQCTFTLSLATGTHNIKVTALSADIIFDPDASNNSVTGVVTAGTPTSASVDLSVTRLERVISGGEPVPAPALGAIVAGTSHRYVAKVSSPVGSATATATCSATLNGVAVPAGQIQWIAQQVNVSGGGVAECAFNLTIPTAGTHTIAVNAASPSDANNANNSVTGSIVVTEPPVGGNGADIAWNAYSMTVGTGEPQSVISIPNGKTAAYRVTFHNNSPNDATSLCSVTAQVNQGLPVPQVVTSVNPMTLAANGDYVCTFNYTFSTIAVVKFTVAAVNVLPLELTPGDNVVEFTTTSLSDNTFPSITSTNVHILERYLTNSLGIVTELSSQSVDITRITLTFTQTQAIIGDFKLTGVVKSNNNTLSAASWTVNDLAPGTGGFANCVTGVDAGATSAIPATFKLRICAQEVPGDPSTQAIFVEYNTEMLGPPTAPNPAGMFGDNANFVVNLDWTLHGSTVPDHASAELQFAILTTSTGFANSWQKAQTGAVTVIRNGGA